jgi:hypothetical protein
MVGKGGVGVLEGLLVMVGDGHYGWDGDGGDGGVGSLLLSRLLTDKPHTHIQLAIQAKTYTKSAVPSRVISIIRASLSSLDQQLRQVVSIYLYIICVLYVYYMYRLYLYYMYVCACVSVCVSFHWSRCFSLRHVCVYVCIIYYTYMYVCVCVHVYPLI